MDVKYQPGVLPSMALDTGQSLAGMTVLFKFEEMCRRASRRKLGLTDPVVFSDGDMLNFW